MCVCVCVCACVCECVCVCMYMWRCECYSTLSVHMHAFCVIMHKGEHQLGTPSNTVYGVGIRHHRTMP